MYDQEQVSISHISKPWPAVEPVLAAEEERYIWEGKTLRPFPPSPHRFNLNHHLPRLTLTAAGPEVKFILQTKKDRDEESRVNIWWKRGQLVEHTCKVSLSDRAETQHGYEHRLYTHSHPTHMCMLARTHTANQNTLSAAVAVLAATAFYLTDREQIERERGAIEEFLNILSYAVVLGRWKKPPRAQLRPLVFFCIALHFWWSQTCRD